MSQPDVTRNKAQAQNFQKHVFKNVFLHNSSALVTLVLTSVSQVSEVMLSQAKFENFYPPPGATSQVLSQVREEAIQQMLQGGAKFLSCQCDTTTEPQTSNLQQSRILIGSMGGDLFLPLFFLFLTHFLKCYFYAFLLLYFYS